MSTEQNTTAEPNTATDPDGSPTLSHRHPHRRREAVQALGARRAPIAEVAPAADDPNPYVRATLAAVLAGYPPSDAAPLLGQLLDDTGTARGPVVHVQAAAAATIGVLGLGEYAARVRAATHHPDKRLRASAVRAAANLGLADAAGIVARALEDESHQVRIRAAEGARDLGDAGLLLAVSDALARQMRAETPHEPLITALVQALGVLDRAGTTINQIITVARARPRVRPEAVRAIGRMGVAHAVYHYRGLLEDPDPGLARFALWGLLALPADVLSGDTVAAARRLLTSDDTLAHGLVWRIVHRAGGRIEPQDILIARRTTHAALTIIAELAASGNSDATRTLEEIAALTRQAAEAPHILLEEANHPTDSPPTPPSATDASSPPST